MADAEDRPHHLGHRARLRRRLLDKGASALADHEILEALLFGAQPRADTKPLAKMLIKRFGGLAGAAGVIPNHLDAEAFILILKLVISGHQYIPSALLESLTIGEPPMPEYGALGDLTPRQREILKLLVQGLPNKAIAKALSIQEITVKAQLTKIFRAFGASNRTELVSIVMGRDKMA